MTDSVPPDEVAAPALFARGRSVRNVILFSITPAVSIVAGLAAAKVWALRLGPSGLGLLAVVQSFVTLGILVGGLGIATAVIREASAGAARGDLAETAAFARAANRIVWAASFGAAAIAWLCRSVVNRVFFERQLSETGLLFVCLAILVLPRVLLAVGVLNALQRVGRAAGLGTANVVVSTGALVACVWVMGSGGIGPGFALGALLAWAAAAISRAGTMPRRVALAEEDGRRASRLLLKTGTLVMLSNLLATGVQLVLPFVVILMLDRTSVGYYRAATIFSFYLDPFLLATSQEFLPKLSSAPGDPSASDALNHHLSIVLAAGLPVLLIIFAAGRPILTAVYSAAFRPAVPVLEWQVIGDVLKLFAFPLGLAVLARRGSAPYLSIRAIVAAVLVGGSIAGMSAWNVRGAGMAYAASQAIAAIGCLAVLRRTSGIRVDARIGAAVTAVVACAVAVELMLR